MSRYFWIFAFFAINGAVPNLPRAYHSLRVPPKPGTGRTKSSGIAAPVPLKELQLKDEDIEDLLFVASPAFAAKRDAEQFVKKGTAKLIYRRAANAVLYEIPAKPAAGPRKEATRRKAAKKRTTKRTTTKKHSTKRTATKKRSTKKR
jgi:topoisomerase IA-like protein